MVSAFEYMPIGNLTKGEMMQQFITNLPHLLMASIVIAAVTVLASTGVISGGEALGVIGSAAGFSLGVGGASSSATSVVLTAPAHSSSSGSTGTATITPVSAIEATP